MFKGGRGSAKSHQIAKYTALKAYRCSNERVLCLREFQNSIADSVHKLLCDKIAELNIGLWFEITQTAIRVPYNNSEFMFKGMRQNYMEVKSTEGVTCAWYEEAQKASKNSLDILIPTIRAPNSELIYSYNPMDENDPIDDLFVKKNNPDASVHHVTWRDNPYFPEVLEKERLYLLESDPIAYNHVWEGGYLKIGESVIFKNRVFVENFEAPEGVQFFFGADWGFSNDPTALVRCFIVDKDLFIDYEAVGYGVEIDETPQLFESIPEVRRWAIKGDNSRPETISYIRRQGFGLDAADKWKGSVEDGIAHLKGFRRIVVHERCRHMAQEFRLYSYKVDKVTNEILPIIVDKHNHCIDALRYALDDFIHDRDDVKYYERLGED